MKISDLHIGRRYDLTLVPAIQGEKFQFKKGILDLPCLLFEAGDTIMLQIEAQTIAVMCKRRSDQSSMEELLRDRDQALIALLYGDDDEVAITARVFLGGTSNSLPEALDFAVGDIVMEDIRKRYPKISNTPENILRWLQKECVIDAAKDQL
jgi:hypothetical protein